VSPRPGYHFRSPSHAWGISAPGRVEVHRTGHLAVSRRLPRLRDLLDHDGYRWTLLRHAIDVEHDGHVQTGGPLHGDVTAFLLTRGADRSARAMA
jgi:hypothetical protein